MMCNEVLHKNQMYQFRNVLQLILLYLLQIMILRCTYEGKKVAFCM